MIGAAQERCKEKQMPEQGDLCVVFKSICCSAAFKEILDKLSQEAHSI